MLMPTRRKGANAPNSSQKFISVLSMKYLQVIKSVGGATRGDYVQDKVRPGTGREGALGYERYIAIEHMDV